METDKLIETDIKELGHQAERRIVGGEEIFVNEEDRRYLRRKLLERDETTFSLLDDGKIGIVDNEEAKVVTREQCDTGIKDEDHISMWVAQTYFLAGMLQPERFISLVSNVVSEIADYEDKNVVKAYVTEFFTNQLGNKARIKYNKHRAYRNGKSGKSSLSKEEEVESAWKVKAMDDAVAVISSTYRWMEVINSGMEAEAIMRQGDYEVYRDLRERTIRGVEKKRKTSLEDIKRVEDIKVEGQKKFRKGRHIMLLPQGTQGLIIEHLVV